MKAPAKERFAVAYRKARKGPGPLSPSFERRRATAFQRRRRWCQPVDCRKAARRAGWRDQWHMTFLGFPHVDVAEAGYLIRLFQSGECADHIRGWIRAAIDRASERMYGERVTYAAKRTPLP